MFYVTPEGFEPQNLSLECGRQDKNKGTGNRLLSPADMENKIATVQGFLDSHFDMWLVVSCLLLSIPGARALLSLTVWEFMNFMIQDIPGTYQIWGVIYFFREKRPIFQTLNFGKFRGKSTQI